MDEKLKNRQNAIEKYYNFLVRSTAEQIYENEYRDETTGKEEIIKDYEDDVRNNPRNLYDSDLAAGFLYSKYKLFFPKLENLEGKHCKRIKTSTLEEIILLIENNEVVAIFVDYWDFDRHPPVFEHNDIDYGEIYSSQELIKETFVGEHILFQILKRVDEKYTWQILSHIFLILDFADIDLKTITRDFSKAAPWIFKDSIFWLNIPENKICIQSGKSLSSTGIFASKKIRKSNNKILENQRDHEFYKEFAKDNEKAYQLSKRIKRFYLWKHERPLYLDIDDVSKDLIDGTLKHLKKVIENLNRTKYEPHEFALTDGIKSLFSNSEAKEELSKIINKNLIHEFGCPVRFTYDPHQLYGFIRSNIKKEFSLPRFICQRDAIEQLILETL